MEMQVRIAHTGTVQQHGVVQHVALALLRGRQGVQEVGEHLHLEGVELGLPRELLRVVLVVRERMVRVGHADLGVGAHAGLPHHQEREDACEVRLERQGLQVKHQLDVLLERGGNADRTIDEWQFPLHLLLGLVHAAFDVAHGVQILRQLRLVARAQRGLHLRDLGGDRVQDAAVRADLGEPHLRLGAVAGAEEALEHVAWVVLHRQRRCGRTPRDGVVVGAAVPERAGAEQVRGFDRQLQGCQLRVLLEVAGYHLVQGRAGADVHALGPERARAGEPGGLHPGMLAAVDAVALLAVAPADHEQAIAVGLDRLQDRVDLERPTRVRLAPDGHVEAHAHIHRAEAPDRGRGGEPRRGERRHHRVEQRECEGGAQPTQDRAARQVRFRDHSVLLIWNGRLFVMVRISVDHRLPAASVSRMTWRTTGMSDGASPRPRA